MSHQRFRAGSAGFFFAVMVVAILSAGGIARAQCSDCTNFGTGSLASAMAGSFNDTAFGVDALNADTTGSNNTATGAFALQKNTTGSVNTADGTEALFSNTTGIENTATGAQALLSNTTGNANTATGDSALVGNTTGVRNTGTGSSALNENTTGNFNTATGSASLFFNVTGSANTASGDSALDENTTGSDNTAAGAAALAINTTGSNNIAIGESAGDNLTTGSNNIDIGNEGATGESNAIHIGVQGTQTATSIAGIFGNPLSKSTASAVLIDSNGNLGVQVSSARYKRDIRDMGDASDRLMKLRPVTFRYKADSTRAQQYGLIAEEVEKVYPELVVDGTDGKPEAVAYQVLPAMLLNEVQKQAREYRQLALRLAQKDVQIAALQKQLETLRRKDAQIDALSERLNALERQVRATRPEHLASAMR